MALDPQPMMRAAGFSPLGRPLLLVNRQAHPRYACLTIRHHIRWRTSSERPGTDKSANELRHRIISRVVVDPERLPADALRLPLVQPATRLVVGLRPQRDRYGRSARGARDVDVADVGDAERVRRFDRATMVTFAAPSTLSAPALAARSARRHVRRPRIGGAILLRRIR